MQSGDQAELCGPCSFAGTFSTGMVFPWASTSPLREMWAGALSHLMSLSHFQLLSILLCHLQPLLGLV